MAKNTMKLYSDLVFNDLYKQLQKNDTSRINPNTTGRGHKAGQIELNKTIRLLLEYGKNKGWKVNANECVTDEVCGIYEFTVSDPGIFYTFPDFVCPN